MKAFAIVMSGNSTSEKGFEHLKQSHVKVGNDFDIIPFEAITPENVDYVKAIYGLRWNYPHTGAVMDPQTGLRKTGYGGRDPKRRQACGMSHFCLWKLAAEGTDPILILEHDAMFIRKLDLSILKSPFGMIGLNDPHGATRLPGKYHSVLQASDGDIVECPKIDNDVVPQGIAGASAYVMQPWFAREVLAKVKEISMWNNDALLCRQIFPGKIGATKQYFTRVQGLSSTTMG